MRVPFSFIKSSAAVYDPAVLSLTGWWRASFASSPWAAVASAGASGSNGSLTEATNPPAVGTSVNSLDPADFDGTNDQLANANDVDAFINVDAFSIVVLAYANTAGTASSSAPYSEEAVLTDETNGFWELSYSTDGYRISFFQGSDWSQQAVVACATGAWHLIHAWYDGTTVSISVDDGTPATGSAATDVYSTATVLKVGANYDGSACFDGDILDIMVSDTDLGGTARTNIKSYCNSRYALSL